MSSYRVSGTVCCIVVIRCPMVIDIFLIFSIIQHCFFCCSLAESNLQLFLNATHFLLFVFIFFPLLFSLCPSTTRTKRYTDNTAQRLATALPNKPDVRYDAEPFHCLPKILASNIFAPIFQMASFHSDYPRYFLWCHVML